jgi:GNAT superfamily N-acetyltransferase
MAPRYRIRRATGRDIPALMRHRVEMFRAMKPLRGRDAALIASSFREYLRPTLRDGRYLGWVAEADGEVVAGVGAEPRLVLPRPGAPRGGLEVYLLNVYTEPAHRGRGLAGRLTKKVLAWARLIDAVQVSLHASAMGRPVYESLGFEPRPGEMRIRTKRR